MYDYISILYEIIVLYKDFQKCFDFMAIAADEDRLKGSATNRAHQFQAQFL